MLQHRSISILQHHDTAILPIILTQTFARYYHLEYGQLFVVVVKTNTNQG